MRHKDMKVGDRFVFLGNISPNVVVTLVEIGYADKYTLEFKNENGLLTRNLSLNDMRKILKKVDNE